MIKQRLHKIWILFLTDPAVRYSLFAKIAAFGFGPLTILFLGTFLKPTEQGVYYVFGSLLQLGAFVDLGFSRSAQQLLAHAFGPLEINPQGGIVGDEALLSKFLATARAIFQIYALLGLIIFLVLGVTGHFYLEKSLRGSMLNTVGPWWSMILSIGFGFGLQSIITVADAANLLPLTNKWRLVSEVSGILIFLLVLAFGGGLWASVALSWTRCLLTVVPIGVALGAQTWRQIVTAEGENFSYRTEVLPLQFRNMIAYGMGFLIFYCYTPLALSLAGAVTAGLIGMSLQIGNIVHNFATVWFNAQIPLMGNLAGIGSRDQLLQLHTKGCRITAACWLFVAIVVICASIAGKCLLPKLGQRYGTTPDIILFVLGSAGFAWAHMRAAFIRAYRIEPFAVLSILQATTTVLLLLITLPVLGTTGAALTYLVTMTAGALWVEVTYRSFKNGTHKLSFHQNI